MAVQRAAEHVERETEPTTLITEVDLISEHSALPIPRMAT
jgi:hypothetical protein